MDPRLRHKSRFFSTGGRPPPGWRTRSAGWSASEAASSSRPRRIVFSSTPVISNSRRSAPWPSRCDSTARYHRRCCSSNRLSNRFIRRWYSRSGCSSPEPHSAHWQDRTTPVGTLRSPLWLSPKLLRPHYSHSVPTGRGSPKTGSCFFTAPKYRRHPFRQGDAQQAVADTRVTRHQPRSLEPERSCAQPPARLS